MSHDFLSALPLAVSLFLLFAFVFSGINSKCGRLGEWEKGRCEARAKGKLSNVSKVGGTRKGSGGHFHTKMVSAVLGTPEADSKRAQVQTECRGAYGTFLWLRSLAAVSCAALA